MADFKIELRKVAPPFAKGDYFDRGERAIFVDGERWGRTYVKWRGRHGTSTQFRQDAGSTLIKNPGARYEHPIEVRSMGRRDRRKWIDGRYLPNPDFKDTEALTLDMVRGLVESGKLRDPKVVRAENRLAHRRYLAKLAEEQAAKDKDFRQKAFETSGLNEDDGSPLIDRIVTAMRWAQVR